MNQTLIKTPKQARFILLPGFALTSFSLAVEALSVANTLSEYPLYQYQLCHGATEPATPQQTETATALTIYSSNGVPIETHAGLKDCQEADLVFVCGYLDMAQYENPDLCHLIRQLHRKKVTIIALSCASFILARAGVLHAKSCTLVPEYHRTFQKHYPDVHLQQSIYSVSDNILTCAGGTATLDMQLYLLGQDQGKTFALRVAQQFLQERIRNSEETLSSQRILALRLKSPCLGAAIELMEQQLEKPYSITALCHNIGTSKRNLERVFQQHQQTTPSRYYLQLRLQQAKTLLQESHLSVAAIAHATGFCSQSHFGKCFKDFYTVSPSQVRLSNDE